jgi:hypothetical protein
MYSTTPVAAPPPAAPNLRPPPIVESFKANSGEVSDQIHQAALTANVVKTETIQFGTRAVEQLAQNQLGALQNSFRNNAVAARSTVVLAKFLVQQTGNAIRVMDADGSVYEGAVLENNANAPVSAGLPELPQEKSEAVRQNAAANGGRQSAAAAQNYLFRVAGTNVTLKQTVVFTGNLIFSNHAPIAGMSATNIAAQSGAILSAQQSNQNRPPSTLWSNVRIAGTAVVSLTNVIPVDASSP